MKKTTGKRAGIVAVGLLLLIFIVCFTDMNFYHKAARSVKPEEGGILFTITTYDGRPEVKPFLVCLGHAWLSLDNRTDHSVCLGEIEIEAGDSLSFSVWAISGHCGVVFNLEPRFISECGRYQGRQSLSVNIGEDQLLRISEYLDRHDHWSLGRNCSFWSLSLWNEIVSEELKLKKQILLYTPERLQKAMNEFDCVEYDRDFSRAGEAFFYEEGSRRELTLCLTEKP